jgi:VanZ family protein
MRREERSSLLSSGSTAVMATVTFLRYWLPPLIWMTVIFWFSTDTFSGQETGSALEILLDFSGLSLTDEAIATLHFLIRKLAHFSAYAVLGTLLWRAFRGEARESWRWRWGIGAFLAAAAYALFDEYHQSLTRTRTPSIVDSLIDMFGSLAALAGVWASSRFQRVRGGASGPER